MNGPAVPGFHIFEYAGDHLVFDRSGPAVLGVDALAASVLKECRQGQSLGHALSDLAPQHGDGELVTLEYEYQRLRKQGLLQAEVPALDAMTERRLIRGYCRWATKGIQLYLIERCNMGCVYCYAGRNCALSRHAMPLKVARRAVDFAFRRAGRRKTVLISLFGGEALLHREGVEFVVDYARYLGRRTGKRPRFGITTNGTLVDAETARYLRSNRFSVVLSLDGPPEIQNIMRPLAGGGASFKPVMSGYEHLRAEGIRPLVRATVTNQCVDRKLLVDFFESIDAPSALLTYAEARCGVVGPFDVGPEACLEMKGLEDRFVMHHIDRICSDGAVSIDVFRKTLVELFGRPRWSLPCGVGRAVLTVDIDGYLYPCHRYVGMPNYIVGDLSGGIDVRRLHRYYEGYFRVLRRCTSCWAAGYCRLRCPWLFSGDDGEFHPLPEWRCEAARQELERAIWLYAQAAARAPEYLDGIGTRRGGWRGRARPVRARAIT